MITHSPPQKNYSYILRKHLPSHLLILLNKRTIACRYLELICQVILSHTLRSDSTSDCVEFHLPKSATLNPSS